MRRNTRRALAPWWGMATDETAPAASASASASYKGTRPGGRSARVRDAVLAATAAELSERGFADLSLSRVAQRAGVAATTVQRRWGTRARLVVDMFDDNAVTAVPDPHQETLAEDLRAFGEMVAAALGVREIQTMLRGMFSLPPEELAPIQEAYWSARFAVAQAIVDRAIQRGELPEGTHGWDVLERLLAPIWMRRLITGLPVDAGVLDRFVEDTLRLAWGEAPQSRR